VVAVGRRRGPGPSSGHRLDGGFREGTSQLSHFPRTRHLVRRQRFSEQTGIIVALVVLFGAWSFWLARGSVNLYVVSQAARLEVEQLPVQVQAPVEGQVSFADVHLGRLVRQGDVILRLDSTPLELRRTELRVAAHTGGIALDALRAELAAEEHVRGAVAHMAQQTTLTARARVSLDEKALLYKEREFEMGERLREAAVLSGLDALRTAADADTQRARVLATSAQAALDTATSKMSLREREARLAGVRLSIAQAEADVAQWHAQLDTLDYEIQRRTVHAPASGVLADVMSVSVGMSVTSEQRIATIVAPGPLRVVASFAPRESSGRVRPGQTATLRFDSFPWAQFGTVTATTRAVGQEPRDGSIRVELEITEPNPAISLEHGMTAACEVAVESTTPLRLLLRSMSKLVTPPTAAPPPQPL
jgi:multidrug resistance efflux pump